MPIIRAKVLTASVSDAMHRVRVYSPHVYDPQSDLVEVVGRQPLNVGDMVLVDITKIFNPLVIGKCFTADAVLEGQNLFRISADGGFTECAVTATKLSVKNSDNTEVVIDGNTLTVKAENINLQGAADGGKATITLNGGDNGQLMNVDAIVQAINNLQTDVVTIRSAIAGATPTPQDGGAGLKTTMMSALGAAPASAQIASADVSDANFKH